TNRAGYEKSPVGNGPFKVTSTNTQETKMQRFAEYSGEDKARVEKLTWRYYSNDLTAYRDIQAGKLDFMDQIPVSRLATYKSDFSDRNFNDAVASIQQIAIPVYRPEYSDPRVRKAISMSINRKEIAEEIFSGTRDAAMGYVSPTIDGYISDQCGEACVYDPAAAKRLLNQAGGFQGEKIELWYNNDGPHKDWIEAMASQIQDSLGVPTVAQGTENFADIRSRANALEFEQPYRSGWQAAYPSIENFLNPIFRTGGSSNDNGYSNPAVDEKLAEADRTVDIDEANALYQEAEKMILQDMPVIPGLYIKQQSVWSDNVKNVMVDWKGDLVVTSIEVK
ncbi:MAG: ABC transporter substrate-binding protein, partial [Corynebacteriales bacterium]|nr:ABC transporter substrate-binding protein [Mycobacteriales bacterium]